ncbi:MAG: aminotransferase class V-fold PLP-dependent enzyme [Pseudomonadota bacterium]
MIYLNAAGFGLPDPKVRARMIRHLQREDEIGQVAAEAEAASECAAVRDRLAALIGADPREIALMQWGTGAWNAAMLSVPVHGKRVLMAPGEWGSNVALMHRQGAIVEVMPVGPDGVLDLDALRGRIDEDVAAVCVPMVCSLTGERYPVEAIGALPRPEGCAYVVDASQALGQMPVSVGALNADVLAGPTRKWLRGPKGTGVLYVSRRWLGRMGPSRVSDYIGARFQDGGFVDHPDARRFEQTGFFVVQRLGLAAALDVLDEIGLASIQQQVSALADHVRASARSAGIEIAGVEPSTSAIVSLRMSRERLDAAMPRLRDAGISCKDAGPDCEPLRPLESVTGGFLRVAPHVYNTTDEIDRMFATVSEVA